MPHRFYTALPGIKKHLDGLSTTAKKLDYLGWIKKELGNMILEFQRITPERMYKISKEGGGTRNKYLSSFIEVGVKATSSKNEYNEKNLYEYVKEQIYIRRDIVIPQIENEIEYLEYQVSLSTNTENKTLDEKVIEDSVKHKLIWFGTEKELDDLLHLWQKENLISKNANINLLKANFVDKDNNCYSSEDPIKIQWMGLNTELAYSLGLLSTGTSKILSDKWIWAKSRQIFLNKNNKPIKNLSVAYHSNPRRFDLLKSLVKKAINK